MSARERLAEQQTRLLESLTGLAAPPDDFDGERVRACAAALLHKRVQSAARAWPALAQSLGTDEFRRRFLDHARQVPLPAEGGPLADGHAFVRQLLRGEGLPDAARLELVGVELQRRWWPVRVAWLRQSKRLVVAVRLPGRRVWSFALPWWK